MIKGFFPDEKEIFWCTHPDWHQKNISHCWFRQSFEVKIQNARLKISVSADNRYILYLNGKVIGRGPCRSDLHHWNYENYEISLTKGKHVLCAKVIQFRDKPQTIEGKEVALAETGTGLAFVCAGGIFLGRKKVISLDTPEQWLCKEDNSVRNRPHDAEYSLRTFLISPPEEEVNFNFIDRTVHNFEIDPSWRPVIKLSPALQKGNIKNPTSRWWLIPREIPQMEEEKKIFSSIVKTENITLDSANALLTGTELQINGNAKITLDAGKLYTAFPILNLKGEKGVEVIIRYSEALFVNGKKIKRDDPNGVVFGYSDKLILSGLEDLFEPFWFRTFRFIEIEVKNNDNKKLSVKSFSFRTCMYPFNLKANFDAKDCEIRKIWEIGWHTARLCANEHYFDCPYYEQLQYVGDTRIQALISYSLTCDGRLGKQAIKHFDRSRLAEGITQSRYPSSWTQVIPGFSLYWIMMIKDYYEYFGDKDFINELFEGIYSVIHWFERRRLPNGLIGHLPYWNFTDWLPEWPGGNPGRDKCVPLTINNLQYAYALQNASYLANEIGKDSKYFMNLAKKTISAVNKFCRTSDGVYLDIPGEKFISQHCNAWAIISGASKGNDAVSLAKRLYSDNKMSKATLYFSFYLFRAWEKTGCFEYFWKQLENWKQQLDLGLSTFPETPVAPRSDCHAWSSSPLYEFITVFLGIKPAEPGFKKILFSPKPSPYPEISGSAPTPFGTVRVKIINDGKKLSASMTIPKKAEVIIKGFNGTTKTLCGRKIFSEIKMEK